MRLRKFRAICFATSPPPGRHAAKFTQAAQTCLRTATLPRKRGRDQSAFGLPYLKPQIANTARDRNGNDDVQPQVAQARRPHEAPRLTGFRRAATLIAKSRGKGPGPCWKRRKAK